MRKLFYFSGLLIASLLLAGCFSWGPLEKIKRTPATTPSKSILPFSSSEKIKNVVLLLPLEGPLGNAGQAIRDGFITAYNNDKGSSKPAHITTVDTSNQTIQEAYRKAVKADADIIVGPLEKNNVQALVQADAINTPTLALNYLDNNADAPAKLYQFGLSPLDEARQAAALAKQNGSNNAIILAPNNNWGQTLAQTYRDEWQALGGNVVAKLYFSSDSIALNQQIRDLVNAHKQKFDVILLAASPQMARQIKPLLKFYYAGDIPVYATSLVYTGTPQPAFDTDLNGVTFCDTPWTLTDNPADSKLRQQISLFWPANFQQNSRLYALGIDTYQLIKKLPQLTNNQQSITGTTGSLFLNTQHLIVRQLTCAQFVKGIPQLLNGDTTLSNNASAADDAVSDTDAAASTNTDNTGSNADSVNVNAFDPEQPDDNDQNS